MLAKFIAPTTIINNMLFVQGKLYNVEYFKQTDGFFHGMSNEWLWFRACELDSYDGTILTYYSWDVFYANWQPMEEVYGVKGWQYIPNWSKKHLTCTFCGTNKSVKYEVIVKDVNGKDCHVPCCNMCIVKHMNH